MCKNKILEKLLAIILIFTLTFANFAFVTESIAMSISETLFGLSSETGHKNVEFEAYFGTEEEKETSAISGVNTEDLCINLMLGVNKSGYLKDSKIEILEAEEGKGINFKVKDEVEFPETVQEFQENTILLKQLDNSEERVNITLPIEYENEEYVNEDKLSKDVKIYFSGIYVDEDGKEIDVSREIILNVSWKDEREVKVESNIEKYIDFGEGVVLQTSVKVDNFSENNTLPVKKTELKIKVPVLEEKSPSNITVVPNSTAGTNGKTAGEIVFDESNWIYDKENGLLRITVENEKQLVKVDEFEDDYLKEADEEIVEEERYYSKSGVDEYFITYTFNDTEMMNNTNVTSEVSAELTLLSGVEDDEFINITTYENVINYELQGKTGDIVSLNIENETQEVSKAYIYSNYNYPNKYETEYYAKTILNIAHKDIVEKLYVEDTENFYTDKQGNRILTDDLYYKQISISKENFEQVLGQDGEIKILDIDSNVLEVINKDYETDESGNLRVNFENKISKIKIETTAPIAEENLVIYKTRGLSNSNIDKETLKNSASIGVQEKMSAKYSYVENIVEVQTMEINTTLLDTITKANLIMDRDNLSTLAINENVELRIELNNATEASDLYEHSVFEIELPSDVEFFEVTNAKLVYGEGLEITSVEVLDKVIRITLDGTQEGINSGVLTNGTNIELNANIKLDLYAPAKTEKIKLHYTNDGATNYENNGYEEIDIGYSAPTGLVTVNTISSYDDKGSTVTSVRQGYQEDIIDIYKEAKIATMELIVMNNHNNKVSDIAILGKIPFKGVKNELSQDIGTTLDTKILSNIVSDVNNGVDFEIYYSSNGEATKDLSDTSNGWTMNPETLENIKSYLIVPVDENYEMEQTKILRFTYQYEIPGNLPHNEYIYGTFATYYTNHSEVAVTEEVSVADLVGLSTGKGPELEISVETDKDFVKEFEEIETTITVKNVGEEVAEEVFVNLPIPQYTKYKIIKSEKTNITAEIVDNNLKIILGQVEKNEEVQIKVYFDIQEINTFEEEKIIVKASAFAKDLGTEIISNTKEIIVKQAELSLYQYVTDTKVTEGVQNVGTEIEILVEVRNLSDMSKTNVIVTEKLDECFELVSANICSEKFERLENTATYDQETKTITWNIDNIKEKGLKTLAYIVRVVDLPEGVTKKQTNFVSETSYDTEKYSSNAIMITVGKAVITAVQTTNTPDTYVKEGETIEYVYKIKNEGSVAARRISLTNYIPDGLVVRKINMIANGIETNQQISSVEKASVNLTILPGEEAIVNVKAFAKSLNGVQEKTVTNYAVVKSNAIGEIKTNSITHIIEADEKKAVNELETSTSPNGNISSDNNTNIVKTYKITGTAWLDLNENGMREVEEQLLPGISAKLINSETGVIISSVTTDSNGAYTFTGVQNGKYLIIFDYDTVKYTVTTYQKADVSSNVNSDVITTQIEQNGKRRNGAVTDVINVTDGSVSNIDIGFVYADMFDLKVEKAITKITVQTSKSTVSDVYNKQSLAKAEIHSKYVSGSTVYVEYTITVKNVGDIAGYAKKIVDYIPDGMTFNSGLEANTNWYTGLDNNLYTTSLSDIELAAGQSVDVKLVLTKQMTSENTGIVSNLAEIYEDYNIYGVSDKNSTPANKAQGENDLGKADTIISVKTGEVFIHISVIITSILLGSVVIFITYNKIAWKKRKGGV